MGDQKKFIESEMDRFEKEISSIAPAAAGPSTSFIPAQLRRGLPHHHPPHQQGGSNNNNHIRSAPSTISAPPSINRPTPVFISGAPQVYNAGVAKVVKPPATSSISNYLDVKPTKQPPLMSQHPSIPPSSTSTSQSQSNITMAAAATAVTINSTSEPGPSSYISGLEAASPTKLLSGTSATDADKKEKKKKKKKKDDAEKKPRKALRSAGGQIWEDQTLQDWDPKDFRLFCGDLGNDVTDEVLTRVFGRYPSFQKAKVVRDKRSNKTKGFGFVSFKDPNDFVRAIRELDGRYVGSRPIKLRKSNWQNRNLDQARKREKERTQILTVKK